MASQFMYELLYHCLLLEFGDRWTFKVKRSYHLKRQVKFDWSIAWDNISVRIRFVGLKLGNLLHFFSVIDKKNYDSWNQGSIVKLKCDDIWRLKEVEQTLFFLNFVFHTMKIVLGLDIREIWTGIYCNNCIKSKVHISISISDE